MNDTQIYQYIVLALALIAWCSLHSAMIASSVTTYLQKHLAEKYRFYRLIFNLVAIITLAPIALYSFTIQSETLFDWHGYLRIPQVFFITLGLVLFFLGAGKYDAKRFLGLTQLKETSSSGGLTTSGRLDTSGILQVIRHPWYAALILILWARPLDITALVVNSILSIYLIIGSRLEENKLIREFGDEYRQYRQQVSMLFPYKWLKGKLAGK